MARMMHLFRKYQYMLLVVFGVMLMVVFVVGDALNRVVGSGGGGGGVTASEVVLTWDKGPVTAQELYQMRVTHNITIEYLYALVSETLQRGGEPKAIGFRRDQMGRVVSPGIEINNTDPGLVQTMLLAQKAEDAGLVVSDDAILDFLGLLSDGELTESEMRAIFDQSVGNRLSDSVVFDQLRKELLAQQQLLMARGGLVSVTPHQAWDFHKRLNRRVQAELVAFPVADFVGKVSSQPTDAEIAELYEAGKEQFPNPNLPDPAFRRRQKIDFEFVRADFNKVLEEEMALIRDEITDEEIAERYELNKENYVVTEEDNAEGETTEGDPTEPPAEESTESSPDTTTTSETEEPVTTDEADEKADDSGAADDGTSESAEEDIDASDAQPPAPIQEDHQAAADDSANDEAEADDPEADDAETSDASTDSASTTSEDETSDTSTGTEETPAAETGEDDPEAEEKPKEYRPLDEELKKEIREELAEERAQPIARQKLDKALDKVDSAIGKYGRVLRAREFSPDAAEPDPIDVQQLAQDNGLESGTTGLVDFLGVEEFEIGQAFEMRFESWPPQTVTFAQLAFVEGTPLYTVEMIKGSERDIEFLYWRVNEQDAYIPELDEVREEIIAFWKQQQAFSLAKDAAQQLVDKSEAGQPLTEQLGAESDLTVTQTNEFSWMSTGFNPMGMGAPTISTVEGVEGIGPSFMEPVFSLPVAGVGVAVNEPHTYVYVVRIASESPDEEILRSQFISNGLSSEVFYLASAEVQQKFNEWYLELEREMGVQWQ